VIRQIKGVDSNKLQPIIRHHNDKDFKVASTADMEFLDYRSIVYKVPLHKRLHRKANNKDPNVDYSLEINESGDMLDHTILADDDDSSLQ
jgi:competence transcription factor ComK